MRKTIAVLTTGLLIVLSAAACSDDEDDGQDACAEFAAKCPPGAPGAGPTCDANRINGASNANEVEDCMEAAADCNAAVACLNTIK